MLDELIKVAAARPPTRHVELRGRLVRLGALATTGLLHPHKPDGGIGSQCQLCFGWCDDSRHLGCATLPPGVLT